MLELEQAVAWPSPEQPACARCGMWERAPEGERFMGAFLDARPEAEGWPRVLVILSGYAGDYLGTAGGEALLTILDCLEGMSWAVTGTLRCARPPYSRGKVETSVHRNCATAWSTLDLSRLSPLAVVLLGKDTIQAVLGSSGPKSIKAAASSVLRLEGMGEGAPLYFVGQSPWAHKPQDGVDLFEEWSALFGRVINVAMGVEKELEFPYREVGNVAEAVEIARSIPRTHILDVELDAHEADAPRRTYWHDESELLCMSASWTRPDMSHRQAVTFVPPAARHPLVWTSLLQGSNPGGHFFKYDFQAAWTRVGVDGFSLVRRLPTGEADIEDTAAWIHLGNQAVGGMGLLDIAVKNFGVPNWKDETKADISKANAELALAWGQHNGAIKRLADRVKYAARLGGSDPKVVKAARKWLDAPKNAELPIPPAPTRPPGTMGFGAAVPRLYLRCGRDTYLTGRVKDEVVPRMIERNGGPGEITRRWFLRTFELTCKVERAGLPVDPVRLDAASRVFRDSTRRGKRELLRYTEVVRALLPDEKFQKAINRGMDPLEAAMEFLNLQSSPMRLRLATEMGIDLDKLPRTKNGKGKGPSTDKMFLAKVSGGKQKWATLDYAQKLWRQFARAKSANDLEIKLTTFRWLDSRNRIHTDYKIIKVDKGAGSGEGAEEEGGSTRGTSSSKPNLQNLKKDPAFRALFVASKGKVFIEIDYDQGEPRVLAYVASCPGWKEIYQRNLDIYQVVANAVYKMGVDMSLPDDELRRELERVIPKEGVWEDAEGNRVDPGTKGATKVSDMRNGMKTRLLAVMYQESPRSFAKKAGITLEESEAFYKGLFTAYPEIKRYQNTTWETMMAGLPQVTIFGRRQLRPMPDKRDRDYNKKLHKNHRSLGNFSIQTGLNDMVIWLVWEVQMALEQTGLHDPLHPMDSPAAIVALIHDAAYAEVEVGRASEYAALAVGIMSDISRLPFDYDVPMSTSLKIGLDLSCMVEAYVKDGRLYAKDPVKNPLPEGVV
jgi:hypothetical protein